MVEIGRRIYYDRNSGNVLVSTAERWGAVVETTPEQDYKVFKALQERDPATVGILQLAFRELAQDFEECTGYRVDIAQTPPALVFSYPDPSEPSKPPVYQAPLSEQVESLKAENLTLMEAVADLYEWIAGGAG